MGFCSSVGHLLCSLFFGILLTIGYWYALYHTNWAYPVAIGSIVFFGLSVIGHLLSAILGMVTLCTTGTIALLSCPVGGPVSFIAVLLIGAFITFIVVGSYFLQYFFKCAQLVPFLLGLPIWNCNLGIGALCALAKQWRRNLSNLWCGLYHARHSLWSHHVQCRA